VKIVITTYPFSQIVSNCNVVYNTKKMKYSQSEIRDVISKENPDVIIAGTERYSSDELDMCPNLKLISRVGVGVSSIDLGECKRRNIEVRNTPDAPTNSVVELTLSFILTLTKKLHLQKMWNKTIGKELNECVVGIVGYGRIGKKVAEKLQVFNPKEILINDILLQDSVKLDELCSRCDIISFHTPTLDNTITYSELDKMKKDVILINTSRGTLFNEDDLYRWLKTNTSASAAIDVFENEPYVNGDLCKLDNVFLTPHIGSYTSNAREKMESEALKNVETFIGGDLI